MRGSDYYQPDDPYMLSMENELLALENGYMKARVEGDIDVADIEDAVKAERNRILKKVAEDNEERRRIYKSVPRDEYAVLQKAHSDMRWLVRRVEASPLRVLANRFGGWRTLVDRYGDDDDDDR